VRTHDELMVLAVDHRIQFEELAAELGADLGRVPAFKRLALQALHEVAEGDPRFGILLDGRFGFDALAAAAEHPYWVGRCIEVPRSRPVAFECWARRRGGAGAVAAGSGRQGVGLLPPRRSGRVARAAGAAGAPAVRRLSQDPPRTAAGDHRAAGQRRGTRPPSPARCSGSTIWA
jgi:hypothetical protein